MLRMLRLGADGWSCPLTTSADSTATLWPRARAAARRCSGPDFPDASQPPVHAPLRGCACAGRTLQAVASQGVQSAHLVSKSCRASLEAALPVAELCLDVRGA
mmetsp:Transcript_61237/g.197312  ORF Transcript_61237/g.197312 Transcript_61237/m.197312 type:complete len:103 (+) Transcript_61237:684-992(+)